MTDGMINRAAATDNGDVDTYGKNLVRHIRVLEGVLNVRR